MMKTLKPERKKLRSCELDLKITVGGISTDTCTGTGICAVATTMPPEYWQIKASTMASHNYILTQCSRTSNEKRAATTRHFPIAPTTWDP
jgi:hypothetical protein